MSDIPIASKLAGLLGSLAMLWITTAGADPLPGGELDPTTIPKYVIPLVIPPVMHTDGAANSYDIAVRQFQQQILPGGIWNTLNGREDEFPATTVWSYGPDADPAPDSTALGGGGGIAPAPNSQFNYPAYTVETLSNTPVGVRWINDLVDEGGNYLPHLLPVDQTAHWANPPRRCANGPSRTDCAGRDQEPYTGPVPIITHVHGAHVDSDSDGYPEAWWLPAANNIPASYARSGSVFDDATGTNPGNLGYADFHYRQDQPATTLWYHDHTLGMTRNNVYAGPAGFWLIRGGSYDTVLNGKMGGNAVLPGPAPVAGNTVLELNVPGSPVRSAIREIPIVVQDRGFNDDGSLFYPDNRAFFEGLEPGDLTEAGVVFAPDMHSDVLPIWNPEAFFNTMVVNGVVWPTLKVAPARYRFRLLNGCNSRFLNLALITDPGTRQQGELPFIQIGAEQGFLPQAVEILTGYATPLPGDGKAPRNRVPAAAPQQALLMGLAERADVIVDFSGLKDGTVVRMINTAPDEPFGGFPVEEPADPDTTGQVMQFVVDKTLKLASDRDTTDPYNLLPVAEGALGASSTTRQVSLNEEESANQEVCIDPVTEEILLSDERPCPPGYELVPFGPTEALLGVLNPDGTGTGLKWTDTSGVSTPLPVTLNNGTVVTVNVTENPTLGDTETWEMYNFTADAHPIHLHLVRFEVVNRQVMGGPVRGPEPWETGYKDTVVSYPGEITRVKALFDVPGLYVWHCHIVEHEDNEMMRPYVVLPAGGA
jgi:FtsP/CotA-like multicopper oxidase with cupredoxin domain